MSEDVRKAQDEAAEVERDRIRREKSARQAGVERVTDAPEPERANAEDLGDQGKDAERVDRDRG